MLYTIHYILHITLINSDVWDSLVGATRDIVTDFIVVAKLIAVLLGHRRDNVQSVVEVLQAFAILEGPE